MKIDRFINFLQIVAVSSVAWDLLFGLPNIAENLLLLITAVIATWLASNGKRKIALCWGLIAALRILHLEGIVLLPLQ